MSSAIKWLVWGPLGKITHIFLGDFITQAGRGNGMECWGILIERLSFGFAVYDFIQGGQVLVTHNCK